MKRIKKMKFWLSKTLQKGYQITCEERGASAVETVALAAIVVLLLTIVFYVLLDNGGTFNDLINRTTDFQIGQWKDGR